MVGRGTASVGGEIGRLVEDERLVRGVPGSSKPENDCTKMRDGSKKYA